MHHQIYSNKTNPSAQWIVLLHGIGGNSKIWYKQLKYLKKQFNVLAIDLPGHFPNPEIEEWNNDYSFNQCADMIIDVLDKHVISKAHFMGISLGSVIIHNLIKRYEMRVETAVLGGMILRFNSFSKSLLFLGGMLKRFVPYMWLYTLFAHIMMPKNNHKQSRSMFIKEARKMWKESFYKWYELTKEVKATSIDIEKSTVPRLYISGSEDHLFIKEIKKHLPNDPNGRLIELDDCGHVCNMEKSEEFNHYAVAFLKHNFNNNSLASISKKAVVFPAVKVEGA